MLCGHLHPRRSHSLPLWCHEPGVSPQGAGHPLPQPAAAAAPAGCPIGAAEPGRASAHTWPGSSAPSPPCQMGHCHCHRWANLPGPHVQKGMRISASTLNAPRVSSACLSHTGTPCIAPAADTSPAVLPCVHGCHWDSVTLLRTHARHTLVSLHLLIAPYVHCVLTSMHVQQQRPRPQCMDHFCPLLVCGPWPAARKG